jgi:hypothetical protein
VTALLLVSLLAAAPVQKLALPGLTGVRLPPDLVEFYAEHLAGSLRAQGLSVVTAKEITTVLGLERQRQLLGCSEASESCMAELAGALGVDGTLMGSIAKLDDTYQVQLKVLSAGGARVLAEFKGSARSENHLLSRLDDAAAELAVSLKPLAPPPTARSAAWIPALFGAAALLTGGGFWLDANAAHVALIGTGTPLSSTDSDGLVLRGERSLLVAAIGLGVGAASLVAAGAMLLFGGPPSATPTPTAWLVPGGFGVGVSGAF